MQTVSLHTHVGPDGVLRLRFPVGLANVDLDVIVIMQPSAAPSEGNHLNGWPPGFFEETYGCLAEEPLERPPQGTFEVREAIE